MVENQIRGRGIKSQAVLAAMSKVPRHRFVPPAERDLAYTDGPLPIGRGQTISQPYIVAIMTELIEPRKTMRVLEIGTGSGYQAAVLAECVGEVDSIEVIPELGRSAASLLAELGYRNVRVRIGDGYGGWPDRAPYRRDPAHRCASGASSPAAAGSAQDRRTPGGPGRPRGARSARVHPNGEGLHARGDRAGAVRSDDRQGPAALSG